MNSVIKVSVPSMKTDSDQIQDTLKTIPGTIHELDDAMRRLGACWQGPAWVTFQQQMESDIVNMLDTYDWIRAFLQAMTSAEKVYGDCEKTCYDTVNRVRI